MTWLEEECEDTADNYMELNEPLPEDHCSRGLECWTIRGEKAKAHFEDGVLEITIPKAEQAKRHMIEID